MITISNYAESVKPNMLQSAAHKEAHEFTLENLDLYDEVPEIKETIDLFISQLNKKQQAPKAEPKSKPKPQPKAKKPRTRTAKTMLRSFDADLRILKRFKGLLNKEKHRLVVANTLAAINKHIAENQINKSSDYLNLILPVQEKCAKILSTMSAEKIDVAFIELADKTLETKIDEIAQKFAIYPSVSLIKRFASTVGKPVDAEAIDKLIKAIDAAKITASHPFAADVAEMRKKLPSYKSLTHIPPLVLSLNGAISGLNGALSYLGCPCQNV